MLRFDVRHGAACCVKLAGDTVDKTGNECVLPSELKLLTRSCVY